jgi:hypothetical protein
MFCHLYLRKGTVFVPTSGNVHPGLHGDIQPVAVIPASNADAIRHALKATIARGNPPTPHYPRGSHRQPVVLKYAGVKTWSAFARGSRVGASRRTMGAFKSLAIGRIAIDIGRKILSRE